jgi:toxin ParE1/3/4
VKRKFEVIWAGVAESDLARIIEYIANENPVNALKVLDKLKRKATALHHSPKRGRIVPELREYRIYQYHELIVAPWRLIYRIYEDKVYVLAVIDSRRNIEDILLERILDAN